MTGSKKRMRDDIFMVWYRLRGGSVPPEDGGIIAYLFGKFPGRPKGAERVTAKQA